MSRTTGPDMQKGSRREPDYGDVRVVGLAHDAAQSCLKAVRYFLIASDLSTGAAETHQYREAVVGSLEGYDPFQSLVAPLCDSLDRAGLLISPAFRLLPDDDAKLIHRWSRNHFELAEFLARNLLDCIRDVDPELYPHVDEREIDEALATWPRDESYSRKDIRYILSLRRCKYATIHDYKESRFAEYVRTAWRFNGHQKDLPIDYDGLQADLFQLWTDLNQALRREAEARAEALKLPPKIRKAEASGDGSQNAPDPPANSDTTVIHAATEEPPAEYRTGKHEKGDPLGPITGTRTALGFVFHKRNRLNEKTYRSHFDRKLKSLSVWARKRDDGEIEAFIRSTGRSASDQDTLATCLSRLELFRESKSAGVDSK